MKFLQGAPIFAVEVRSENDYGNKAEKAIAKKRADYFAAGTEIVRDIDLLNDDVIKSFHRDNPDNPNLYNAGFFGILMLFSKLDRAFLLLNNVKVSNNIMSA